MAHPGALTRQLASAQHDPARALAAGGRSVARLANNSPLARPASSGLQGPRMRAASYRGARKPGPTPARATATSPPAESQAPADGVVPEPIVKIDNHSDPYHTIVAITYGDRLGELADTVAALRHLNLNVRRAKIKLQDGNIKNKFFVTDSHTADKIMKSARLEEIRLTIYENLQLYHPEAGEQMGWGKRAKKASKHQPLSPLGMEHRAVVRTTVRVVPNEEEGFTELHITTTDRPGLLTDIVHVLKDVSINVISAEIDTEGPLARDTFLITYHGDVLSKDMNTLVVNMLQYYLSMAEVEKEESY